MPNTMQTALPEWLKITLVGLRNSRITKAIALECTRGRLYLHHRLLRFITGQEERLGNIPGQLRGKCGEDSLEIARLSLVKLQHPIINGKAHQFGPTLQFQFRHNIGPVAFNCALRNT
jgi:hypothetical protein